MIRLPLTTRGLIILWLTTTISAEITALIIYKRIFTTSVIRTRRKYIFLSICIFTTFFTVPISLTNSFTTRIRIIYLCYLTTIITWSRCPSSRLTQCPQIKCSPTTTYSLWIILTTICRRIT